MATKQTRPARANSAGKDDTTFPVISARYMRVQEFAQFCNVSETLARRWIYSGAIPAVKIQGLVMIDALRAEQGMATRHAFKPVKTSPQRKGAQTTS
jgi:Helix-turn-helix domain